MPELSWRHHALIQAALHRGPLSEENFNAIFESLTGRRTGSYQQLLNDYLLMINRELAYVQFELRACRNQYDGKIYYGVVNNVADEQSKLGTKNTVPQIAYYKGIIEAIVQDERAQGSISSIGALNIRLESQVTGEEGSQSQRTLSQIPPAFKNFSFSQKEGTLDELVKDGWLCATHDGNIGLGIRSFLDLRSWFRGMETPTCKFCNEAAVKAERCQNEGCVVRIHQYCLTKKFVGRAERVCPGCGVPWNVPTCKTEVVEEENNGGGPRQSQGPSEPTVMRKRRSLVGRRATRASKRE